ncbi:unnamed protein product [Larinioides sclopetarius]|uniref:Uncharacterized protein n=1 Tax=Larinioides sclopetarius TaxID=280406 RepID=A0AAV1ZIG4_9ARAC
MFKVGIFAAFVLFFFLIEIAAGQKPPRAYAKSKCEKRIKNETMLEQCKTCVEQYSLPEYPSKTEARANDLLLLLLRCRSHRLTFDSFSDRHNLVLNN